MPQRAPARRRARSWSVIKSALGTAAGTPPGPAAHATRRCRAAAQHTLHDAGGACVSAHLQRRVVVVATRRPVILLGWRADFLASGANSAHGKVCCPNLLVREEDLSMSTRPHRSQAGIRTPGARASVTGRVAWGPIAPPWQPMPPAAPSPQPKRRGVGWLIVVGVLMLCPGSCIYGLVSHNNKSARSNTTTSSRTASTPAFSAPTTRLSPQLASASKCVTASSLLWSPLSIGQRGAAIRQTGSCQKPPRAST